jgi:hypothetical protein
MGLEQFVNTDSETGVINGQHSNAASPQKGRRQLRITAENDCRRLHCTLRDLSSLLQALGRLADHFTGEEKFSVTVNDGYMLVDRYVGFDNGHCI